jgi:ParB family chromosome partitioning protein
MQEININELRPHPKNDYFFDDMEGQKWTEFLDSVKTSGIIEPIVVTQEKIIVSGHQRVRACKELNIPKIMAEVRIYDNEDKVIKDLIETNIRQRGDISSSSLKMGRIICELERIYGISKGNNQHTNNVGFQKTQKDVADEMGIDNMESYRNYKKLTTLIPELQDMVDTGSLTTSVAGRIIARLSPTDQKQLILTYGKDEIENATQAKTQQMIDEMQRLKNVNAGYEMKLQKVHELENQISDLKQELDNRPTVEKTVEVKPNDYDSIKKSISGYKQDYTNLESQYNKKIKELTDLKAQVKSMTELSPEEQYSKKLKDDAIMYCAKIDNFISQVGGLSYLSDHIKELPDNEKRAYIKATELVEAWAYNIKMNMKQYLNDKN